MILLYLDSKITVNAQLEFNKDNSVLTRVDVLFNAVNHHKEYFS